jgi:serine protease inhibitor
MKPHGIRFGFPRALSRAVAAAAIGLMTMASHGYAAEDEAAAKPQEPAATEQPKQSAGPAPVEQKTTTPEVTEAPKPGPDQATPVAAQDAGASKSAATAPKVAAAPPIDPAALSAAQARLGSGLVGKLAAKKGPQTNVVVSPGSVALVFSLLDLGANDTMRGAIHQVLGFGAAKDKAKRDLEGVRNLATSVMQRANEGGPLALGNLIVFDPETKPFSQALDSLKATGAGVLVEPLDKPETIARINDWVKEHTRGLIPTVLDDPPGKAGLVAVNALYFKDRWKSPFDPGATRDDKFKLAGGSTSDVRMMHADGRFLFQQGKGFVGVKLPYASDAYELIIVTSQDAPLAVDKFQPVESWLGGQGFGSKDGEIAIPRFSMSGSEELLPTLDALGLATARNDKAAFNGFSTAAQTIARVVQKTELRVNEEGTEAAAATAVTTLRSVASTPAQYVKMVVDKPFLFALRDKQAGLVLLQGYVAKPDALAEVAK